MASEKLGLIKFWNALNHTQQLSLSAAIITTIFGLGMYLYKGGTQYEYVLLAAGTMVALISDRINQYNLDNSMKVELARIAPAPSNREDLRYIGNSINGIEWISRNTSGARHIRNTVFLRQNENLSIIDAQAISTLVSAAKNALKDGCTWYDVFVASERHVIDKFFDSLPPQQRASYKAIQIPSEIPLMQMTIFNFKNDTKCVVFGFGFQGARDSDTRVFYSDGISTVGYFEAYFDELRKMGAHVYPPPLAPQGKAAMSNAKATYASSPMSPGSAKR